jgi:hypothetical protein
MDAEEMNHPFPLGISLVLTLDAFQALRDVKAGKRIPPEIQRA